MVKTPSIIKIITVDYIAFVATLFPLVLWGMYLLLVVLKNIQPFDMTFSGVSLALTVVSLAVLTWRIRLFFTLFNDGLEVPATLSNIWFFSRSWPCGVYFYLPGQKKYQWERDSQGKTN